VIGKLVAETIRFSREWRIMCADENCVVGLMRGGGLAKNGHDYSQTYCQIMTIRGGLIAELHEFFDTALVELALNDNPTHKGPSMPARPFAF
jgi:ketosteroid isomerase-like protein